MQTTGLVVLCLVCAGHGRRTRSAIEELASGTDAESIDAESMLAKFLLALNPTTAFRPSCPGGRSSMDKPCGAGLRPMVAARRHRLGYSAPVMTVEDERLPSGIETPDRQLLRATPQIEMQMRTVDGAPIGPPPDMPSLLLDERIVYLGAPLVPSVSELIVAELLFLNFNKPEEEVQMYINSVGTAGGATETDAFAILDTMRYITPEVGTCCVGSAFGTAAMLLAAGTKGKRVALPNAQVVLLQPSSQTRGQASDIAIRAREVLATRKLILSTLSELTGQSVEKLQADSLRTKYLSPDQAREYGIIDKVADASRVSGDLASRLS